MVMVRVRIRGMGMMHHHRNRGKPSHGFFCAQLVSLLVWHYSPGHE
jgi:hypothetical protein